MLTFEIAYLLYICVCLIYCIFENKIEKKSKGYILAALFVAFALLMAMRPITMKDMPNYIRFFEMIDPNKIYSFSLIRRYEGFEYGYLYLMWLFKKICDNYRMFFGLIALFNVTVSVYCLTKIQKRMLASFKVNKHYYGITLLGYISYAGVLYNGITIRAGISITFILMAIRFCFDKRYLKTTMCLLMAFIFQRTSVIVLFVAIIANFLKKWGDQRKYIVIWMFQGILLFLNAGKYFLNLFIKVTTYFLNCLNINGFSGYLQGFDLQVGKIDWLVWFLVGIAIFLYMNEVHYKFFLEILLFGMWIIVFFYGIRAISRLYDYCIIFIVPVLNVRFIQANPNGLCKIRAGVLVSLMMISAMTLKISFA